MNTEVPSSPRFISPEFDSEQARLRQEFTILSGEHGPVLAATLDLSALGVIEARINGVPVSSDVLTPGWTSYEWRLRKATYRVESLLRRANALALSLGNGWFRGRLGWTGRSHLYGDRLAGLAHLRISYADGYEQFVQTDGCWRSGGPARTRNDLYDGQDIDARLVDEGWMHPGFDDSAWSGVREFDIGSRALEPYIGPPVRRQDSIAPIDAWDAPSGRILVDFGQNIVGWVRARLAGHRGDVVTIRHGEVLEGGELGTRPLRTAAATDRFILSGGDDDFEPTFTFHGFRYAEVDGWPGGAEAILAAGGLEAVVISSDLRRTGHFECSNDMLNRFHANVVWGMRGNFVDVPTDCPQRDERLGWTGDISVFAPSASFLYDVGPFLRDWLRDLALEQDHHGGAIPLVVPDVMKHLKLTEEWAQPSTTAIWGDAAVWVPWALWRAYGDSRVIEDQWNSMTVHTRRIADSLSPTGLWDTVDQLGDWLDPDAPHDRPHESKADPHVVATLCAFRTARIMVELAGVLGSEREMHEFDGLATRIRRGFMRHFHSQGRLRSDAPTVYALAIAFGMLDGEDRSAAGARLAQLVSDSGYRISTGFAGTPFITDALSMTGHVEEAYRLLLQTEPPSWLYPVTMGATTVWERWDSMLPDGSIHPGEMTSFNHYALGAVVDWMHRVIGGIDALEPGYRRILIAPQPGPEITHASVDLETPYGTASVRWVIRDGSFIIRADMPVEAVLRLPNALEEIVGPGVHERVVWLAPRSRRTRTRSR